MDINELKKFAESAGKLTDSLRKEIESQNLTPEQMEEVKKEFKKANFEKLQNELKESLELLNSLQ